MNRNNSEKKIPVIVIFAPTATGKTALTLKLFGSGSHSLFKDKAEIISADSMAVYKYMNIGTAKPDKTVLSQIPHHLIYLVFVKYMMENDFFIPETIFDFAGGEPTMYERFDDILELIFEIRLFQIRNWITHTITKIAKNIAK